MTEPAAQPQPGEPGRTRERILTALAGVRDPELRRPVTELGMIERVEVPGPDASPDEPITVAVRLTITGCPAASRIEADVRHAVEQIASSAAPPRPARIEMGVMTPGQREELTQRLRAGSAGSPHPFTEGSATRVIAITSGKGGVGKSSVTANLAVAFAQLGLRAAIIDADVHGYSVPGLMGLAGAAPTRLGEMILPPIAHGVQCISIGMFLGSGEDVVAWRGPMLHRTLEQFLRDVHFGEPDVLLLDLPPGTGDVALSLGQLLPGAEVIVVTTPQPAAAEIAWRSGLLARKTGQRVMGVIETMAPFTAPDGSLVELFGSGGGMAAAGRLSEGQAETVPLLASIPLSLAWREAGDAGEPLVLRDPADPAARAIVSAARRLLPETAAARPVNLTPR